MDEIESLKGELEAARETNRRLNRRCQEFESLLNKSLQQYLGATKEAQVHAHRAKQYANELRDLCFEKRHGIHDTYRKHWERLPKPSAGWDGIKARVDEALAQIGNRSE